MYSMKNEYSFWDLLNITFNSITTFFYVYITLLIKQIVVSKFFNFMWIQGRMHWIDQKTLTVNSK